jgi:hypothetical protein
MADTNNVFISWSGPRSKQAAEALREWLGTMLQNARPWMSETDIEKGSRGLDEIARALEGMKVGIICLTPENLNADWILYEAGALSKTLDAKTRVCTYLLAGLEPGNLKPPLGLFQWTRADKSDTRKLIHTINKHLDATPVLEGRLDTLFDKMWPDLEQKLADLPQPSQAPPPLRSTQEMVAEILELSRVIVPVVREVKDEIEKARRSAFFGEIPQSALLPAYDALERGLSGKRSSLGFLAEAIRAAEKEPPANPKPPQPETTSLPTLPPVILTPATRPPGQPRTPPKDKK